MNSKAASHLIQEHQTIARVLAAFEKFLDESEEAGVGNSSLRTDPHRLWRVIDYLAENLFMRHEEKEEGVLLPELSRHGLSWTDGALAHVRQEHRHGRYLTRSLIQAVHQKALWSRDDHRHFLAIGRAWLEFLRHHMAVEERALFPLLDRELTEEQDDAMVGEFEAIDCDFGQMEDAQELHEAGRQFAEEYGAADATAQ